MQNYTIGENCSLPSKGLIYNTEINPEFKMRSMTTEEEMKRLAITDYPYQTLSEIIDACIIGDLGTSSYDLCIGDFQYLLYKLRIVTYGADYPVINNCVYCGSEMEDVINLDELPLHEYSEEYEKYKEFDLPKSGKHIKLRPQTPRMLENATKKVKEFKRKTKGHVNEDPTLLYLICELIETIDGKYPNPLKIEDWVRKLPMIDSNVIIQSADKMNDLIGVDSELVCECENCGLASVSKLKMNNEFFRPALRL